MTYTVVVFSDAYLDILNAKEYYEGQAKGLGGRFGGEVESTISRIAINPQAFSTRYRKLRAAKLRHFPYLIYYRLDLANTTITILRVFNTYQKLPWS